MGSDRSKMKAYEKQKGLLVDVGVECMCHHDPKIQELNGEIEAKVKAMDGIVKEFKVLVVKAEMDMKKESLYFNSWPRFSEPI
jgi:hypothetical protein